MKIKTRNGFSVLEMAVAGAMGVLLIFALSKVLPSIVRFQQRMQIKNQLNTDSRKLLDTLSRLLRNGEASTLRISTPAGAPPNSMIEFRHTNGNRYEIRWNNRSVVMEENPPNPPPRVLANEVTAIMFTGDSRDPAILNVSLQMDAAYHKSGNPGDVYSLHIANHMMRMVATEK